MARRMREHAFEVWRVPICAPTWWRGVVGVLDLRHLLPIRWAFEKATQLRRIIDLECALHDRSKRLAPAICVVGAPTMSALSRLAREPHGNPKAKFHCTQCQLSD